MQDSTYYLFESDGETYGLEVGREGSDAINMRKEDDGCLVKMICFNHRISLDENPFDDQYDFFCWLHEHDDYVVAGVSYNEYDGTFKLCGEVDDDNMYDYDVFAYVTDDEPYYQGHDKELELLEYGVKYEEMYNLGMTIFGRIYSIDDGYTFEDLSPAYGWDGEIVLHEEDSCGGFVPDLDTYQSYDTEVCEKDAEIVLDCMGWSFSNLRKAY